MARDPLLAQIHIGRKELGLDDETYRDVLDRVTGQRSAGGLSETARKAVIAELKRLGFKPGRTTGARRRPASGKRYVRKVFAVWGELKRDGIWRDSSLQSLRKFVKRLTGCDDPEWLSFEQASKVIEALMQMQERG
ncbi:gp16 family protein [Roseobacteraceae bacterium NS-SX3]